jgi:Uma2 family endonuclease
MTATVEGVMPLESGDRLTREEFHRRYCANPQIRRAELISGVVYVPSPMRYEKHDAPAASVAGWMYTYTLLHPEVQRGLNATIFLDDDTEVQPDGFLFYDPPSWSGGLRHTGDDYLEGAPELVVEVAASSASYDLHDKLEAYRRAGVQEYVAWRVLDKAIDWFCLRNGRYVRLEPDERGVITSEIFPGLRLNVAAMLAGDDRAVVAELRAPDASAGEQEP